MSELDDLVRQRRFEEIHDARQQVIDDRRKLDDAVASGRASDEVARKLYQRAVNRYVHELETLLNPPGQDAKDQNVYWVKVKIGEIHLPNGKTRTVNGLLEYLTLDEEITTEIRVRKDNRYFSVAETEVREVTVQPSWELIESAFRTANAALADIGMELKPDTKEDLYAIKRDPDDYPKPAKDGIKKPQ